MGLFRLGLSVASLLRDGWKQKAFIDQWHKPLLLKLCNELNYELSALERKRMLFIYPWYVPVFCAPLFTSLKGRSATLEETKRLSLTASMACICDDLIDEEGFTHAQIVELLSASGEEELPSKRAMLLVRVFEEFKRLWPVSADFLKQLHQTLEWIAKSALQENPAITLGEIEELTRKKNGHTFLLLAAVIDTTWTEEELRYIYRSAFLVQLSNDCLDLYTDTQKGICTYFNKSEAVSDSRTFYLKEFSEVKQMAVSLVPRGKHRRRVVHRMSMLHAFAMTALDQYEDVENRYGKGHGWKDIPRKELIVDLEKFRNQLRTLRYVRFLDKL